MNSTAETKSVKFFSGEDIPLEFHKVRTVQRIHLKPIERRLEAIGEAGFNTFLLKTKDVYLDMLTDSGTNAMSDTQVAAMSVADDAYAGSASYERMEKAAFDLFDKTMMLPVHQGRAAEHIISQAFVKKGDIVPMNYHFTTTRAHIENVGGEIREYLRPGAIEIKSSEPFKGNMDTGKLEELIARNPGKVPLIRMEASTNLIGGQPFSLENLREVSAIARKSGIPLVLDASLLGENVWLIKQRESAYARTPIKRIYHEICGLADIVYFSARKISSSRGGAILTSDKTLNEKMLDLVPLFEGFFTYGGMSIREVEAIAVGLTESIDEEVIGQSPSFIAELAKRLDKAGVPVVLPPGALGCHVDARGFLPQLKSEDYPAGSLAAAFFIASGVRGMERGTISSSRDAQGKEIPADIELLRLALPRRVFTLSQIRYVEDRLRWLYANRGLIGGLRFVHEPPVLRFFNGRLEAVGDWPRKLAAKFRADFGDSL